MIHIWDSPGWCCEDIFKLCQWNTNDCGMSRRLLWIIDSFAAQSVCNARSNINTDSDRSTNTSCHADTILLGHCILWSPWKSCRILRCPRKPYEVLRSYAFIENPYKILWLYKFCLNPKRKTKFACFSFTKSVNGSKQLPGSAKPVAFLLKSRTLLHGNLQNLQIRYEKSVAAVPHKG